MIGALFETNIKYDILTDLLKDSLSNIKYSSNVNVIFDLKSFYRKVYRTDINGIISDQKIAIEDITSSIINTIGHYRNYLSKNGKYSTFYILYSSTECKELQSIYPDYKKYYYDKYLRNKDEYLNLNNICKSVTKQIKIICRYLPNVFFIDTSKFDEFVYCNYLIREKVSKTDINLMLSSDPIMYQVLNNNTFALDIKGNQSKLISTNNAMSYITKTDSDVSSNLFNILLSICGNDEYSINKITGFGYKKSFKIINDFIIDKKIIDKTYMQLPLEVLKENVILEENMELLKNNFKVVFPIEIQFQNSNKLLADFMINKPSATRKQFDELNEKIFLYFPLNISFLLKGETL